MEFLTFTIIGFLIFSLVLWTAGRQAESFVQPSPYVPVSSTTEVTLSSAIFLKRLVLWGFLLRFAIVIVFNVTDAIQKLNLSPDSLKYHKEGEMIAVRMQAGFFDWANWIDNAWFQFTGLVYYLLGPYPQLIQLFNIILGSLTPIIIYFLLRKIYIDERVAKWTALFTALFPSFIFWSCLMLKDPLSVFAMSLLVLAIASIRRQFHVKWLFAIGFSLLVFLGIREYMFFICLFLITASFLPITSKEFGPLLVKLIFIVVIVGMAARFMGFGFMGLEFISQSFYFDIDYINSTRIAIGNHGSGAFFKNPSSALWGQDFWGTAKAAIAGIFFFFVSIDLTNVASVRQLMALPEILLFITLLPALWTGLLSSWKNHRHETLPLFVFAFGIMAVYGSAATNMGAMFRWRMQAMPFFLAFLAYGLTLRQKGFFYRFLDRLKI